MLGALLGLFRAPTTTLAGPTSLDALGLSGSVGFAYYSSNHGIDDRENFPGLNLTVKQRGRADGGIRWFAESRILAQQVGHEDEDAPHGSARDLRYSDEVTSELREAYVEIERGAWDVTIGKQIIVWGRADEINPTDVLSPKNYLLLLPEGMSAYRFGTTALKIDYFAGRGIRLTGVWLPLTSTSLVPLSDPPPGVRVDTTPPAIRLENGIAGMKIDRSGADVDASISYAYGYNLLPEVRLVSLEENAETDVVHANVDLRNARQHMIGADAATARGRFGFRGEVAYYHTDNPNGRRVDGVTPSLFYVLGVEHTLPGDVSVILQYLGRWVIARVDPERALDDPDPIEGRARFLTARETFVINQQLDTVQNGWSLRLGKTFWNDTLNCELLGVHYFERNDFFLRPRVAYDLTDGWRVTVGGEVFGGPRVSFFGRIKDNSGAFVELLYSF
ncbi:MAG: hypothetical protein IT293_05940 [Deltaproteobacteria bacterium]|nr:hypothetical protein [Deltaproteobacteria bacterium]